MNGLATNKILVPVDFSPASFDAVILARTMAKDVSCLHVLNVIEPISELSPGVVWGDITDQTREVRCRDELNRHMKLLDLVGARVQIVHGCPGMEIARYATENKIDLIVIPSHGYRGVKHLLLGSVTERVMRHAPCPVLVLKRKGDQSAGIEITPVKPVQPVEPAA